MPLSLANFCTIFGQEGVATGLTSFATVIREDHAYARRFHAAEL
jgi:hypothetical protein